MKEQIILLYYDKKVHYISKGLYSHNGIVLCYDIRIMLHYDKRHTLITESNFATVTTLVPNLCNDNVANEITLQ